LAASVAIFSKMSLMNEFLRRVAEGRCARQATAAGRGRRAARQALAGGQRAGAARENTTHMMDMALEEMPVSGCTCFSTL
jgi:hypothetical protein